MLKILINIQWEGEMAKLEKGGSQKRIRKCNICLNMQEKKNWHGRVNILAKRNVWNAKDTTQ